MKTYFPQLMLIVSLTFVVANTGCQRNLINSQPSMNGFLAKSDESQEMLFGIGRLAERNGKTEKAIEAYESILANDPNHAASMHRMGVVRAKQGYIKESIAWMEKAAQTEAPSAELLGDLGYVFYLEGDLTAAKSMLESGLQKKPDDARMTNNLAIVAGAMQQYNESLDLFRQHGTEAEALAAIAYVQTQGGHVDAAKQNYLKSLELDGKLEVAANGLIQLDRSNASPESFLQKPLEIEMPSSVQLAAHHNAESLDSATDPAAATVAEPIVSTKTTAAQRDKVTLASAEGPIADESPQAATIETTAVVSVADSPAIESVAADPLPMERPKVEQIMSSRSKNTPAVKGVLRGPAKIDSGEEAKFQMYIENTSSNAVNNVEVELLLDHSIEITSVSHEAWLNEETNSVSWTFDQLTANTTEAIDFDAVSNTMGRQTHRLTIKVDGQPVGELSLDTNVE